jgi:type I restriction-modification system DNA methylase subunit
MSKRGGGLSRKETGREHRKELVKLIEKFSIRFSGRQVWDDMVYLCAAALSQPRQWVQSREDEYLRRINAYPENLRQLFPQMLAELILAFEREGFADILGEIYMSLEFNNQRGGQFFTPYNVSLMMAKMLAGNLADEIEKKGFITVGDPCCGSGSMLVAFAQNCYEQGVDFQRNVLFVGQDIDPIVARMCYVQLSLLGCSGYVVIGNSLTQPMLGDALMPEASGGLDVWVTPMFYGDVWQYRRALVMARGVMG